MKMDYKAIADNDPGGDLDTAFLSMAAETVSQHRGSYRVNDIMIAAALGLTDSDAFLDAVEPVISPRQLKWLQGNGIDINHPDTVIALTAIDAPHTAEVLAMGNELLPKYSTRFNKEHLRYAREARDGGII